MVDIRGWAYFWLNSGECSDTGLSAFQNGQAGQIGS
jgi:hypothetical protein